MVVYLDARSSGWREVSAVLFRDRSYELVGNTVALATLVVLLAATVGTSAAWLIERWTVPGRRIWSVLLILPMAMPDFVVGFAWHSILPRMEPLGAATLIMTLSTYPLVFLPVAAALRRSDPALEDVARSLGNNAFLVFVRVTLPSIRGAIAGGMLLAALGVLSEYGAFEAVRFHTLTTEIFDEFQFEPNAAAALSIPLVLMGLAIIGADSAIPRRRTSFRAVVDDAMPRRGGRGRSHVVGQVATTAGFAGILAAGVGFPILVLVHWVDQSRRTTLPAVASLATATITTFEYCALAGLGVLVLAGPVVYVADRYRTRLSSALYRATFVTRALPGVIVALSLGYISVTYLYGLYETTAVVVAAYTVLLFPLGVVCVHSAVAAVPSELSDVARSLGRGRTHVFATVTLPLIAPGLIAGFFLVFVTATTELTSTLQLAPVGVKTLATQFWAFQSESAYGAAAPYALVIVVVAVIPGAVIGLWFDGGQRGRRAGVA